MAGMMVVAFLQDTPTPTRFFLFLSLTHATISFIFTYAVYIDTPHSFSNFWFVVSSFLSRSLNCLLV